ncbi:MAG: hypothetical protein FWG83_05615 [Oscillospiraceae bacterium]|nr:hypothetical protein [Oscillospiraceae bacterium]
MKLKMNKQKFSKRIVDELCDIAFNRFDVRTNQKLTAIKLLMQILDNPDVEDESADEDGEKFEEIDFGDDEDVP